ncbi:hypothetical protein F4677DRAFT_8390 [Hypoxylon crocopeplum]|nr:hypothetical protein F4677DRAFT_8390 [Hypoxylon crocopeplum]
MSSWGFSPGEGTHTPPIPSPLNPLSTETSPKRHRRAMRKHEPSPTQILMRQKAAAAWKSMSSREGPVTNYVQTSNDEVEARRAKQGDGSNLTRTEYDSEAISGEECDDADLDMRQADMEKQALMDHGYREGLLSGTTQLPRMSMTTRLVVAVGIVCIIGILSAVRAVSRRQAWRS